MIDLENIRAYQTRIDELTKAIQTLIKERDEAIKKNEVVRCKDCKYWDNGVCKPTHIDIYDEDVMLDMDADDFCSRGEKKDD